MWNWLETFLELMARYGFPLVAAGLFLIIIPLALRGLWREYRRLSDRHSTLLTETARLMEINAAESELAQQTIAIALHRIADIKKILNELLETLNSTDPPPNPPRTRQDSLK